MHREKLFRKIKRILSQFIETEYWYRFRRLPSYWYDDEENIYSPLKEKIPARDWLTRTWGGENDILDIMRLKIEHMFWNLKEHGCQAYFYLDSGNLESPYRAHVPENDRKWAIDQIFHKYFSGSKPKYLSWNHSFSEESNDTRVWTSKLWIGNTYTQEYDREDSASVINDFEHHSDSGFCHYYMVCQGTSSLKDNKIISRSFYIAHETDIQIPPNEIPKKQKLYDFNKEDFLKGIHKEAPQYRKKDFTKDFELSADFGTSPFSDLHKLQDTINQNKIPIANIIDEILSGEQSFNISMSDYRKLSPETRLLVRGKRRNLTQLLYLRHLIKNIQKIDHMNNKYRNIFLDNEKLNEMSHEEKILTYKKAERIYKEDRRIAYRNLADFMAEHGDCWWD